MKYIHEYEALNGRQCFRITRGFENVTVALGGDVDQELADFYQARRDEELGRWRDPKNPDMVVYPIPYDLDAVWVVCEGDWTRYYATRTGWEHIRPHYAAAAAKRYFQAHPEPKPWHGAEGREVWEITVNGEELLCRSNSDGDFTPVFGHHHWATIANGCHEITAGRRIWPEEDK